MSKAYLLFFSLKKQRICSLNLQSFFKDIQDPQKFEDLFTPLTQSTHKQKPSHKPLLKSPLNDSTEFTLL